MAMGVERLEFRLLGPFEVASGGCPVNVGGPHVRGVLARLLVDAGRTVSLAALVEELWGDRAPLDAGRTVRTYVSRLRKALAWTSDVLVTRAPGYVLHADPDAVDAVRFERLADAGRRALDDGQPQSALERLDEALSLWRGEALAEFDDMPALTGEGTRLERRRLTAVEDRNDAALAVGLDSRVAAEVEGLVLAHPLRERLWGQLMIVRYRSGRQAEALAAFRDARAVMVGEYGVEPSPALVAIQQRILRQDPDLVATTAPISVPLGLSAYHAPAQLPLDVRDFIGREDELAVLDALLSEPGPSPVAVPVLSGTAGVGKTTLAVHWAHRVADQFPDGQLYVNLRGFDADGVATDPSEAVRGFLDALGVPPKAVPAGLTAQVGRYRSLLAGKRVLVMLDNARDAEQVRPLLPGAPGCLAIVTSRDQLTSLVATEGAVPLSLNLLDRDRGRDLLVRRLGRARAESDPAALERIVTRCAGLPLALAIASARIAVRPDFPLSVFADELAEAGGLDTLHGGDAGTDLRSLFSWSCRTLGDEAKRLFRLLGLHPGPDIGVAAAASLGGIPVPLARRLLTDLCRASLLSEHVPGRYAFHDLLKDYAAELAHADDDDDARYDAVYRILDHYLHSAQAAERRLGPRMVALRPDPPPLGVVVDAPGSHREALAWFATERRVLTSAVGHAHAAGLDRHAWQLAHVCTAFLHRRNLWPDLSAIQHLALDAAERSNDRAGQAYALRGLGLADRGRGDFDSAADRLQAALQLFQQIGDRAGQALTYQSLAWIASAAGRGRDALELGERALRRCRAVGEPSGEATALNDVGWYHAQLGEYDKALTCCEPALALLQRAEDEYGQAHTWDSLGYIHRHLGDHQNAVACYRKALHLFRQTGDAYSEATGLTYLGDAHHTAGDSGAAEAAWRRALWSLERLGHPDAANVRERLETGTPNLVAFSCG